MSNQFRREPFVTLASGSCEHCGEDAYYRVFMPYLDPLTLCATCRDDIVEVWES